MNNPFKKIICPVDFSEPSERALSQAVMMAEQAGAELLLLTVVSPIPVAAYTEGTLFTEINNLQNQLPDLAQKQLASLRDKCCATVSGQTSLHVAIGIPFVEIVRYAREKDADLIVMGSHGRTGIAHLMIGSVAEHVVRKATCSVLVVRDAQHRFVMP